MENKKAFQEPTRARMILTTILSVVWIMLLIFAFVAAKNPPWLEKLAYLGQTDESLSMKNYGDNFIRQGNYPMAIEHYRRSLEIKPDNPQVMANLAMAYHRAGYSDKGLALLEKALTLKSTKPELICYDLGDIYSDMGQNEKAISYYLKAVDSEIGQDLLYYKLGTLYYKTGHFERARLAFEKVLEIQTDPRTPYFNMIRKSIAIYQDDPNLISILRSMLREDLRESDLKNYDLDFVRQCNSNNIELRQICKTLGNIYLSIGDTAKSTEYFERSRAVETASVEKGKNPGSMSNR